MSIQRNVERPRPSAKAMAWLNANRSWLEETHPGKWIAVGPEGLLAVGDSATQVAEEARSKGQSDPLLTGVRRKDLQGLGMIRLCH